jgi:predicted hydrolase (HD superfamily)
VINVEYPLRRKSQETKSLARKMLQLLGIKRAYVRSVGDDEEERTRIEVPLDYNYSKQNEAALLEAERNKVKGLLEMQRQCIRFL